MRTTCLMASMLLTLPVLASEPTQALRLDFDDGVETWRVVLDGVMGGRSSGRVSLASPGILAFTGDLSLENNGGFSQMRKTVPGDAFIDAEGIEITVRGDGRTYNFDVRCSNVRMMAGGFQQTFETVDATWTTVRLPFEDFRLYSFGRRVPNAPALEPDKIESIGVTLSDKVDGPFRLEIDSIRTYAGETGLGSSGNDLVSVARAEGLDTLLELVAAAEIELPTDQRVTIFAPTDDAFAALPEATLRSLLAPEGRETLRAILAFHVTTPGLTSADLLGRRSVDTLNGQRLPIEGFTVGQAGFMAVDVPFDAGIIHVLDTVLMPELESISDLAASNDDLSMLATAVTAAGLDDQLGPKNGGWTVFAPANSAFAALPAGALESLLETESRSELVRVLGLHVVPGRLYANELLATQSARTLFGDAIQFALEDGQLRVGAASVLAADIEAANGVIHVIDRVLMLAPQESPSASAGDEGMRLLELAISRGVPLFNDGQHAACAAVYEVAIQSMIALGRDDLGRAAIERLEMGMAEAETKHSWADRAWAYRRAMDDAYAQLANQARLSSVNASR